jgi:hypothetical protein
MADVSNVLLGRLLKLTINNDRGADNGVDSEKKQAAHALACSKAMLTQQSGIHIDV